MSNNSRSTTATNNLFEISHQNFELETPVFFCVFMYLMVVCTHTNIIGNQMFWLQWYMTIITKEKKNNNKEDLAVKWTW